MALLENLVGLLLAATTATSNCDNWHQVFYSTVEEFCPTHLCTTVVFQPHWRVFDYEPPF